MQEVKSFFCGKRFKDSNLVPTPVEDQITAFLKENPNYTAKSISVVFGPEYKEAFVIFDVGVDYTPLTTTKTYDYEVGVDYKKSSTLSTEHDVKGMLTAQHNRSNNKEKEKK